MRSFGRKTLKINLSEIRQFYILLSDHLPVDIGDNFNNDIENDDGDQLSLKKGREAKPCHDFSSDFLNFRDKTMKIKDFL